jgi:hypothetical protein
MASWRVCRTVLLFLRTGSGSSECERAVEEVWFRRGVVEKSVGMFRRAVAGAEEYRRDWDWNARRRSSLGARRRERGIIMAAVVVGELGVVGLLEVVNVRNGFMGEMGTMG